MPEPNYTIWQYMSDLFNQGGAQPVQPTYNSADYIGSGAYYYHDPRAAGVPAQGGLDYAGSYFPEVTPQAYLPRPPVSQNYVEAANMDREARYARQRAYLQSLSDERLTSLAELKRQRLEEQMRFYEEEIQRRSKPAVTGGEAFQTAVIEQDGKYYVVPTMPDWTREQTAYRFRDTGEHWGSYDDFDAALRASQER